MCQIFCLLDLLIVNSTTPTKRNKTTKKNFSQKKKKKGTTRRHFKFSTSFYFSISSGSYGGGGRKEPKDYTPFPLTYPKQKDLILMYSINFFVCLICVVLDKMGEYIDMSNAMLEVRDKCVWHQLLVLYVQFFKISFYG